MPAFADASTSDWREAFALLDAVLQLDPSEHAAWLAALPPERARLAGLLEELLQRRAGLHGADFMRPPADAVAPEPAPGAPGAGAIVGPYRLLKPIGEGGMASVWLAVRADGLLERPVALKLPHVGWGGVGHAERLARERDIVASLAHPNIARLYDAGVAADGRPFLALEYVDGQPIDAYAVAAGLPLRARIGLIVQVARAVAHAHARLVVHRDLKPSNILVDAEGQVHLLDFGIARLIDPQAYPTGAPAATQALGRALTPDYASPEQIRGAAIGTASDVYSLGVVMFELLVGVRPYRLDRDLGAAALIEAVDRLEIPRASVLAGDPALQRQLAGDLDAILARALACDSAERYPTMDALADDLQRHLRGDPVAVRGPARFYVLGRTLRRYRWGVAGGALLVVTLAVGLAATAWQAHRAEIERDAARRAATREEAVRYHLTNLFRGSISRKDGTPVTAKTMLDRSAQRVLKEYRDDPQLAGKVVVTLADLYGALEDIEGQAPLLEGFLAAAGPEADRESVALAQQKLAHIELMRGHLDRAAELLPKAEALWASAPDKYREQHLEALLHRGALLRSQGDLDGSIRTYQAAIAERSAYSGAVHRETANLYNSLAITLTAANRLPEALDAYRANLAIYATLGQSDDLDALIVLGNTGTLAYRIGRLREAEATLKTAFEKQRELAGDSGAVAASMGLYGTALAAEGRLDEARGVLLAATDMAAKFVGVGSPLAIQNRLFLTDALTLAGDLPRASELAAQNLAFATERVGATGLLTLRVRIGQARIELEAGHADAAQAQFVALLEPLRKAGRPGQPLAAQALIGSGEALLAQGRAADAVAPLREAVELRQKLLWDQSWELAQARVRLGEALKRSKAAGATDLLDQGAATLATQLGNDHPQVLRARRVLALPA